MIDPEFHQTLRRVTLWPIGGVLLGGVVLVVLIQFLLQSAQRVEHTDQVIGQVHAVETKLVDMETGLRGYQITGDPVFLDPYERGNSGIESELQALSRLVRDNATQLEAVRGLYPQVDEWRGFADETLRRRRDGSGFEDAAFNAGGKQLMDSFRARLSAIEATEQNLRLSRARALGWIRRGVLGGVLLAVLVLGPAGAVVLRRFLRGTTRTYRESTEQAHRQAEALRVTLRSIGDAVIATNPEGRVTFLNPVAEQLTGWRTSEAAGKMLEEVFRIFNEQTGQAAENPVARVLREEKVIGLANHTVLRARDGREIPIEDSAAPIRGDSGEVYGVILVFHDVTAARAAQREVRDARTRLEATLSASEIGTWVWDIVNNRVIADKNVARFFSVTPEDAAGGASEHYTAAIHPDDRAKVEAVIAEALHSESGEYELDYRLVRPDGGARWVVARGKLERDAAGQPIRFPGVVIDITARKEAETAQRETQEFLRLVLDSAADGFYSVDHEGATTLCNAAFLRILGFERAEDAVGRKLHDVIHHSHPDGSPYPKEECPLYRTARTGEPAHRDDELFFRLDGSSFPVEYWSYPILREGELHGAVTTFIDITARKQAERTLRESAERFRFLAESMPQKIFTAKPNGEVDYFNRQWTEFTGMSFEQIRDWGWLQLIHPEDVEENIRRWRHSIETQEPFYMEHRFLRLDGQYRWHVSRAVPMRDAEGNMIMWIGSNSDVEEIRQAQEKAERASRAKDEFLAALSHELRTPLTPVLMMAATLRDEERLPLDVREQLAMMQRNIELEARLIDDLLDLTRIAHGKLELRPQSCDAHSLVALAVEMVRSEARRKRQTLEVDLAAERSQLHCDPARMQQVFWNLLKNAVKFTPEAGRITVRSSDTADRLTLEISDNGAGIPAESLERIFRPFEQGAAASGEQRLGGLGLGLSIAKAILDLHGGQIKAESAGAARGATFRVELPATGKLAESNVDSGANAAAAATKRRRRSEPRPTLRLLLVEDHEPTLSVLERLLTRAGHHVTSAMSVAGALEAAAKAGSLDAVVSDVGLPDGTGFELMGKLRERHGLRGVALSGYGMDEDLRRSREAGFSAHLTKPINFAQLEEALDELMANAPGT